MTICEQCGERTKGHATAADCIRSLQRRNAAERQTIVALTTAVGDLTHEVDRLTQRVEMLAVAHGHNQPERVAAGTFRERRRPRLRGAV